MRGPTGRRAFGVAVAWVCFALSLGACRRKHLPVDRIPELPYPSCVESSAGAAQADRRPEDAGTRVAGGHIRSGPESQATDVDERFELRRTACGYVFRGRQEWPLDTADIEVHYDASLTPIWAWKRMTMAGSPRADGNADIRRYELRTGQVFIKRRDAQGEVTLQHLLPGGRLRVPEGARVGAVVGPGRGIITAWLKRAKLPVGGKTYELVLDFRGMVESLELGSLRRDPDEFEASFGKKVRVYTFFGRETVFADDEDVVIGDLAGMRPDALLTTPAPKPIPMYGVPDPVHTP